MGICPWWNSLMCSRSWKCQCAQSVQYLQCAQCVRNVKNVQCVQCVQTVQTVQTVHCVQCSHSLTDSHTLNLEMRDAIKSNYCMKKDVKTTKAEKVNFSFALLGYKTFVLIFRISFALPIAIPGELLTSCRISLPSSKNSQFGWAWK